MAVDDVPLPGQRRRNWVLTNDKSETRANPRTIRLMATDGILVSGNAQAVAAGQAAVELDYVRGATLTSNHFGSGSIVRNGQTCHATLVMPKIPRIPGR